MIKDDMIKSMEYEIKVLRMALVSHGEIVEENARLRNGHKGSCLTCESVGELNIRLEKEIAKLRSTYNSHTSYVQEEMERSIKLEEKNKQLDKENGELKERLDEAESIIIKINYIGYGLNEFDLIEAYKKKWDRD